MHLSSRFDIRTKKNPGTTALCQPIAPGVPEGVYKLLCRRFEDNVNPIGRFIKTTDKFFHIVCCYGIQYLFEIGGCVVVDFILIELGQHRQPVAIVHFALFPIFLKVLHRFIKVFGRGAVGGYLFNLAENNRLQICTVRS